MCGIIHVKRFDGKSAKRMVAKRYEKQKTRGQSGYGYVTIGEQCLTERAKYETAILKELESETATEIMFHHRYPTSTPNIIESTHPIFVSNDILEYDYYVVHNGVINNDVELFGKHKALGFIYTTYMEEIWKTQGETYIEEKWNDSEAFAIELAMFLEEKSTKIDCRGSIAFVAIKVSKKTGKPIRLLFGRNSGNPLKVDKTEQYIAITSEGKGDIVPVDKIFSYSYKSGEMTQRDAKIGNIPTYSHAPSTGYRSSYWDDYPEASEIGFKTPKRDVLPLAPPKPPTGVEVEEEDFNYIAELEERWWQVTEEIEDLNQGIKKAHEASNYDLEIELTSELDCLEVELAELNNELVANEYLRSEAE